MAVITARDMKIKIKQEDVDTLQAEVLRLLPTVEEKETFHMVLDPMRFRADAFLGNTAIPVTCRRFDYAKRMDNWQDLAEGVIRDLKRQFSIDNETLTFEAVNLYEEVNRTLLGALAQAGQSFYQQYLENHTEETTDDRATALQLENKRLVDAVVANFRELESLRANSDIEESLRKDLLIQELKAENKRLETDLSQRSGTRSTSEKTDLAKPKKRKKKKTYRKSKKESK